MTARSAVACVLVLALAGCGRLGFDSARAAPTDGAPATSDALALDSPTAPDAAARAFQFVQSEGAYQFAAVTSQTATFDAAVHHGDTLVAAFDYNFATSARPTAVTTDAFGDAFAVAVPQDNEAGYDQYFAYAVAGSDGSDAITVTLDTPTSSGGGIELRILEYAGLAATGAVDVTSSAQGTAPADRQVVGPALVTTGPDELLVTFTVGHPSSDVEPGSGWTSDSTFDNDLVEHELAPSAGSYTPVAQVDAGGTWTLFAAAFR